jgi:AAA ATPase domain
VLLGRTAECATLDHLLASARAGRSQVVVVRGEPGVGKTALLEYVSGSAPDCRVLRAAGIESELELPFAGYTSSVHRYSTGSSTSRARSARLSSPRSVWGSASLPTGSSSRSPC